MPERQQTTCVFAKLAITEIEEGLIDGLLHPPSSIET
jgi:hypothetical protein